ncbi:hypothetical protein [Streptomyces sp. NPDC001530]|uniref:hypothetical protein n=1 Tax=Streptomyces sp. NPDC001530 TaxID=3364582 RepID=UPI0036955CC3
MAANVTVTQSDPAAVARATLDGVEAGLHEARRRRQQAGPAALAAGPEALYPQLTDRSMPGARSGARRR